MTLRSRSSVYSNDQASREAFCCISRAETATPPAFAALPGANRMPADLNTRMASGVEGMFAPSATSMQPLRTSDSAPAASSSFWVAQGSAMSQGTSQIEPPSM